jgi:tetratricopeptide (TPR) repeat protein
VSVRRDDLDVDGVGATTERDRVLDDGSLEDARTLPQVATPDLGAREGQRLGRFTLTRELGRGAMGEVWAAHDPELDREVAVKLLRLDALLDGDGQARLRREAQAMARLNHPNVVRIYELGSDGDLLFCAMELVDGETLRQWLTTPRSWRDTLRVLLTAGRGVAAVHAAGLIHRDVKPDNVMIARDGRIVVTDFGLAKLAGLGSEMSLPPAGSLAVGSDVGASGTTGELTRVGTIVGTPFYMPLEQIDGLDVDALSDQFSFCVTSYEALFGARPFTGTTLPDVAAAICRGPAPAARRGVPRALLRCIVRGLAAEKEDRWPSMGALLAAMERAAASPRRRRRRMVAVAAAVGVVAASAWAISRQDGEARMSEAAERRMERAWGPARIQALRAAAARAGDATSVELGESMARALDRYRDAWVAMRIDAWTATHVRDDQSERLLDQRMLCLDRLADEMDSFVQIAIDAERAAELRRLAEGVLRLTPVSTCTDQGQIAAILPGVVDPEKRPAAFRTVEKEEARLRAVVRGKPPKESIEEVAGAVVAAERLGVPGLAAGLLLLLAQAQDEAGNFESAEATLRRTIQEAARARQHRLVALGWIRLIETVGIARSRPQDALALEPAARAAVAQAGDDRFLRGDLAGALGALAYRLGDTRLARDRFQEAYDAFLATRGARSSEVADVELSLALVVDQLGQHDEAMRLAQRAHDDMRAAGREFDALTARALKTLSALARKRGDLEPAVRHGAAAVDLLGRLYGEENPAAAFARCHLGQALSELKRHGEAIAQMERCEVDLRRALGPTNPDVALTQLELGSVLEAAGRTADAERIDRTAVETMRAATPLRVDDLVYSLAELARMVGHRAPAEAVPIYDEAMRGHTSRPDRDVEWDSALLEEIARIGIAARRADWALAWFDRLPEAAGKLPELRQRLDEARRRK